MPPVRHVSRAGDQELAEVARARRGMEYDRRPKREDV